MPVHPRLRPILAAEERLSADQPDTYAARRYLGWLQARWFGRLLMLPGPKVPSRHVMVPVAGGQIRVRLYEPAEARPGRPLHVFFHGGGWCVGDLDQRDPRCRTIAAEADCTVASVDYRMAPENAFPTPMEDAYAALCWLVEHAGELGVDPARVSVGGESAGANLAAVVSLLARDRSGPSLVFQWLDVPAVDLTMSQPSVQELADGPGLTKAEMDAYVAAYLQGHDPRDPLASPLFAADHAGLPPALVTTVEHDPLRDDGRVYAEALRAAGVAVQHEHLPGLVHASFAFTRLLPEARAHEQRAVAALARAHAAA
ncbi:MAG TPA: alpha/beta hydrolase [Acidimicrobiales bacterium]|nr:alpha/beta hydrolase [Acidimicrobiales bacterium]